MGKTGSPRDGRSASEEAIGWLGRLPTDVRHLLPSALLYNLLRYLRQVPIRDFDLGQHTRHILPCRSSRAATLWPAVIHSPNAIESSSGTVVDLDVLPSVIYLG